MFDSRGVFSLITGPAVEPVTLEEIKRHCVVDIDEDNELLSEFAEAARELIEHRTNRQMIAATWELGLDCFPVGEILLQISPAFMVNSIAYLDSDGDEQTVDATAYVVDFKSTPARIHLIPGESWPTTGDYPRAVKVNFSAGYVESDSADALRKAVPRRLKLAIKWLVAHWYKNREAVTVGKLLDIPFGVENIIRQFRVIT